MNYIVLFGALLVAAGEGNPAPKPLLRVGAAQPRSRLIDWRLTEPSAVLAEVDRSLGELEGLVHKAGAARCDALAFPEDTPGLGRWEAANRQSLERVLPEAVRRMLERLGQAAAAHHMYLVCSSDTIDSDRSVRNTAFFLGRDGREIGRYHKVNMPVHELDKRRGDGFPVFPTSDLGTVGMLICYDMVFPEAPRCLALAGADVIFHPTLGGAAIGDEDLNRAAFRTRAAENFVYLVVAQRGGGSMIVSPQGKILAEGKGPDDIAMADIDPQGGREGGDAMNRQADMRARLFRERSPAAFGLLTDPSPPVLSKVAETIKIADAVRIGAAALTTGEERFKAAEGLLRQAKSEEALAAFERLTREFPQTWIDHVSRERLARLGWKEKGGSSAPAGDGRLTSAGEPAAKEADQAAEARGIAERYPADAGIGKDPRVLFAEDFETGSIEEIGKRWGEMSDRGGKVMAFAADAPPGSKGRRSLQMTATLGENTGGHLYTRLKRGEEKVFARFYVKFPADSGYVHHFVTLGGYRPPTGWPQGGAGERPRGDDRFTVGIEPYGNYGLYPAPGAWNFYTYWSEMKQSADGKHWGNGLAPAEPALVPRDRWQCVEVMVKCNSTPEKSDGEAALWLDGRLVARFGPGSRRGPWSGMGFSLLKEGGEPFEGFRWRTHEELKVNFFWLLFYVTENAARQNRASEAGKSHRVWFDDIVIATAYVGPLKR
jgi:predicted amidohydrolase